MFPKQPNETLDSITTDIDKFELNQNNDDNDNFYPRKLTQPNPVTGLSVDEILIKYQNNPQLLNQILAAKAQEDQRKASEKWYQAEQARLQTKFIEYELNRHQENIQGQPLNHPFMNTQKQDYSPFILTGPYYHHHQLNSPPTHTSSSFHTNRTVSSLPITNFSYGNDLQQPQPQPQQDSVSIASSSPSIGFMSPPSFGLYNQDQHGILSSSSKEINQPFCSFTNIVSAPIVPSNVSDTNKSQTTSELATPISINNTKSVKRRKSGKTGHIHRTLSYESVMSLTDFNVNINTKRNNSLSPTLPSPLPRSLPSQPLDHDKVMEALRAKLRKSSSPSQAHKSKPSLESTPPPPPLPPPPPNTNPTTGILLLNLKNRRRKVSITKRGNNDYGSSSKP